MATGFENQSNFLKKRLKSAPNLNQSPNVAICFSKKLAIFSRKKENFAKEYSI
jgi:hypothetical protein